MHETDREAAWERQVRAPLERLYGRALAEGIGERLSALVTRYRDARPKRLRERDRTIPSDWYREPGNAVYVLYADRFNPEAPRGKKLVALRESLPYFEELGVNVLHILPILAAAGDGGFAVRDYRQVDEAFGTQDDFVQLVDAAHARGLWIALDFVLNHVADTHEWAEQARAGSPEHVNYFVWDDSGAGRPWDLVPNIFPEFAPGHWDYVPERCKYVWATFYKRQPVDSSGRDANFAPRHAFAQWDLNYANPQVLLAMAENLLFLANWGVDVFRLDAAPFLWKTKGTSCTSRPQVYDVIRVFRGALESVAPGAVLLAEACQEPKELLGYFAEGEGVHLAYHFPLMPALWQAAIEGDDAPLERVLQRMAVAASASASASSISDSTLGRARPHWWIFSECHDEVSLEALDDATSERLWRSFRTGSGGLPFRFEPGSPYPRGVSGTTFSLLHGDVEKITRLWEHKLRLAADARCTGTPLFYMGEELGVDNLPAHTLSAEELADSRFIKRVPLTHELKARRQRAGTKEHELFGILRTLLARRGPPRIRTSAPNT